jgi:hypothetical protein
MAVKLSRKCGCKRKSRNKQTKRGKTMKGGSRGSRPGSMRGAPPPAYSSPHTKGTMTLMTTPPPAYTPGTLKRSQLAQSNAGKFNIIGTRAGLSPGQYKQFKTATGRIVYYPPQNN